MPTAPEVALVLLPERDGSTRPVRQLLEDVAPLGRRLSHRLEYLVDER